LSSSLLQPFALLSRQREPKIDDEDRSVTAGGYDAIRDAGQPQIFDAGLCLGITKGLNYLRPGALSAKRRHEC
jgi:hypothetical protein